MRRIAIQNFLPFPVHVTVVFFAPVSLRFVLSKRQIPVPTGEVIARHTIGVTEGIVTDPIEKKVHITFIQMDLAEQVALTRCDGTDEDGMALVECSLHVPTPDDGEDA